MEQWQDPFLETNSELAAPENSFPPKYQKPEAAKSNIWLKSIVSLALYLLLGYYFFHSFNMLLLITIIVVFHELGHFIAMKAFRYKDLGIFFIPLLGAYVSGSKREVSQRESAIILLAGPLPGIIAGIIFYLLYLQNPFLSIAGIPYYTIAILFLFLNIINLLPVYPLDGGQLLNRVFLDEESIISKIFVWLSIGALIWFALYGMGRPFYPLLIFPAMLIMRMFGDSKLDEVEKKVEAAGINLDTSYEEMPGTDYWRMRDILVTTHPAYRDIKPGPPYEYHEKEDRIMTTIQSLLHRHLVQDVSLAGKIFILIICIAAIASPWLLNVDLSFFRQFGI